MLALHHWAPVLHSRKVMIATDNTTVVSYINKQRGSHSHSPLRLIVELSIYCDFIPSAIRARHIPGFLNNLVDRLSQSNQPISTEWGLHPEITTQISEMWGHLTVDLFATVHNTQLPQFTSPIPEPQALVVNALSQPFQERSMYMFPPFPLLNKVIQKLQANQDEEIILIVPLAAVSTVGRTPVTTVFVWINLESYHTVEICCLSQGPSRMESCANAVLPSSRIFRRDL